jgi:hypothetical protein
VRLVYVRSIDLSLYHDLELGGSIVTSSQESACAPPTSTVLCPTWAFKLPAFRHDSGLMND